MEHEFAEDMHLLAPLYWDKGTNDRVAAIVCASYVEKHLTHLIRLRLPGLTSPLTKALFGERGPISTLGAKIDVAEAMQVLSVKAAKDARLITRIRNKFAHNLAVDSFDHQKVRALVEELQLSEISHDFPSVAGIDFAAIEHGKKKDSRTRFWMSAVNLCIQVALLNQRARRAEAVDGP
jgi:hypothetical protein